MARRRADRAEELRPWGLLPLAHHDWRRLPPTLPAGLRTCVLAVLTSAEYLRTNHPKGWRVSHRAASRTIKSRLNGRALGQRGVPKYLISHGLRFEAHYRSLLTPADRVRMTRWRRVHFPCRSGRAGAEVAIDHTLLHIPAGRAAGRWEFTPAIDEASRYVPAVRITPRKSTAADCAHVISVLPDDVRAVRYDCEPIHGDLFSNALYFERLRGLPTRYGCHDSPFVERFHRTFKNLILDEAHRSPRAGIRTLVRRALRIYHDRFHRGLGDRPASAKPNNWKDPVIL